MISVVKFILHYFNFPALPGMGLLSEMLDKYITSSHDEMFSISKELMRSQLNLPHKTRKQKNSKKELHAKQTLIKKTVNQ